MDVRKLENHEKEPFFQVPKRGPKTGHFWGPKKEAFFGGQKRPPFLIVLGGGHFGGHFVCKFWYHFWVIFGGRFSMIIKYQIWGFFYRLFFVSFYSLLLDKNGSVLVEKWCFCDVFGHFRPFLGPNSRYIPLRNRFFAINYPFCPFLTQIDQEPFPKNCQNCPK